jgi:site-specific recombinase XerD
MRKYRLQLLTDTCCNLQNKGGGGQPLQEVWLPSERFYKYLCKQQISSIDPTGDNPFLKIQRKLPEFLRRARRSIFFWSSLP